LLKRGKKVALLKRENCLSVKCKCELLHLNRSGLYYKKKPITSQDVELMNEILDIYTEHSFYGYRKIRVILMWRGYKVNRKRVQRLMQLIGLRAVCPKKKTTIRDKNHSVYPYLLKDITIRHPNQVWQVDITYVKIRSGFIYLICLIDVYSRRIMGWNISIFLDTLACENALENALLKATPEIINSDQGCQFTSDSWCNILKCNGIKISMDGKGRWADNIYIERLWRTIKYELVYMHRFETVDDARIAIANYIEFYNIRRPHQALGYSVPDKVYKEFKHVTNKAERLDIVLPLLGIMNDSQILSEKLS
jgi:putative transposase